MSMRLSGIRVLGPTKSHNYHRGLSCSLTTKYSGTAIRLCSANIYSDGKPITEAMQLTSATLDLAT